MLPNRHNLAKPDTLQPAENTEISTICEFITGDAPTVLRSILKRWPWLRHIFADGGYAGPKLKGALQKIGKFTMQIVKRSDNAKGFEVLPCRWVVERTFAWLGRCRRLAKDFERTIESAQAWVQIANIRMLTRRLARA
jgi:putative transposase